VPEQHFCKFGPPTRLFYPLVCAGADELGNFFVWNLVLEDLLFLFLSFSTTTFALSSDRPSSHFVGAIYALYTFSELVLGVHPQAFWIEKETEFLGNVSLDLSFYYNSWAPEWTYRGFFVNDEDQLGGKNYMKVKVDGRELQGLA
jgi:hypothetical protein